MACLSFRFDELQTMKQGKKPTAKFTLSCSVFFLFEKNVRFLQLIFPW